MSETKKCTTCGNEKSINDYYTYNRGGKTRHIAKCKKCKNIQSKHYMDIQYKRKIGYRVYFTRDMLIEFQNTYLYRSNKDKFNLPKLITA